VSRWNHCIEDFLRDYLCEVLFQLIRFLCVRVAKEELPDGIEYNLAEDAIGDFLPNNVEGGGRGEMATAASQTEYGK